MIKELIEHLIAVLSHTPERQRFILGVVGYPGAGKSTLADLLVGGVNSAVGNSAIVVPMDGFHYSNERLSELGLLPLKGIQASVGYRFTVEFPSEIDSTVCYNRLRLILSGFTNICFSIF